MSFYIIKSSGQQELFDIKKFRRSLLKAGASRTLIGKVVREIKKRDDLRSTKDIYEFAIDFLDKTDRPIAARYNLKRALMDLGPAGFPFEKFIAEVFRAQGYDVEIGKIINGICVNHEVDVSAQKDQKHYMIECKFHNRRNLKSDVKVALYIKARFDDIKKAWEKDPNHGHKLHGAWIVTNTVFTSQAIAYGSCVGIHMLDWKHPKETNLPDTIHRLGLHPITALTSLNSHQKKECIKAGFVLCRHARDHKETLKHLRLTDYQIKKLINESEAVCSLTEKK
ncbi:restriction endonuclease [bacterium]|nr:restriction endonuclease [bacterium]